MTCVVMEATGAYWKPFYSLLADLAAHRLVRGSSAPDLEVTEVKDLVRARTVLVPT